MFTALDNDSNLTITVVTPKRRLKLNKESIDDRTVELSNKKGLLNTINLNLNK